MDRKAIAADTLRRLESGEYEPAVSACIAATRAYVPGDSLPPLPALRDTDASIELCAETTLQGARELATSRKYARVGVLNFASARNPGGGFLNGAQAQEESLARSSALYASLRTCAEHYEYHRSHRDPLYSDRVIVSPDCPVFRDDDGVLLSAPYLVDFLTCPAPNAGVVRRAAPEKLPLIAPTLARRAARVFAIAAAHDCEALVLGAWGCGVFQNDPTVVADALATLVLPGGAFSRHFAYIHFSIFDAASGSPILNAFRHRLQR